MFSIIAALIDNEVELRVFEMAVDERCVIRVRHFHVVGVPRTQKWGATCCCQSWVPSVRPVVGHTFFLRIFPQTSSGMVLTNVVV